MTLDPCVTGCGDVADGISVRIGASQSGFVIPFADLERVYLAAKAYRNTDAGKRDLKALEYLRS